MPRRKELRVKKKYTTYLDAFTDKEIVCVRDFGHYSALKRMIEAIDKDAMTFDRLGFNLFAMSYKKKKPRRTRESELYTFYDI